MIRDSEMIIHRGDIVILYTVLLVGIYALTRYQMYVDSVRGKLSLQDLIKQLFFVQKNGHI